MPSTHHRRHHKSSPPLSKRPSDASSVATTDAVLAASSSSSKGNGVVSYFRRLQRRWGRMSHRETDTLLPTTYASSSAVSPARRGGASVGGSLSPAAKNCNNFLMGGNYYPGKDKKRRHMRRRTLWYRLFCSSNHRKMASILVVTYILFWHVLIPFGDLLLQVGSRLSGGGGLYGVGGRRNINDLASWLQHDTSLVVPTFLEEQKSSLELVAARSRLQYESTERKTKRLSILREMAPAWFQRNHPEQVNNHKPNPKTASNPTPAHVDPPPKAQPKGAYTDGEAAREKPKAVAQPGIDRVTGEAMPIRTLHSTRDMVNSNCPVLEPDAFTTTLVTQTSFSRMWILNETCKRWTDPILAVVFVPHGVQVVNEDMSLECPNVKLIQYMADDEESKPSNYPVNRLRNVGLNAVKTSHVLAMDIDFVPSMGLADTIRNALTVRHVHHPEEEDSQALVVPAFDRLAPEACDSDSTCAKFLQKNSSFIPHKFQELQECVEKKDCIVFQSNNNPAGHYTTKSEDWLQRKWFEDADETVFTSIPCFHTARYEPYVVLRWCPSTSSSQDNSFPVPQFYDERFHGYGKNKIEMVSHLRKSGFRFAVLPEGFIVHNPHPESNIKEIWNDKDGSDLHQSMDKLYTKFLKELDAKYVEIHDQTVKLCKR